MRLSNLHKLHNKLHNHERNFVNELVHVIV